MHGLSVLCTTVYAYNDETKRLDLWNYIAEQSNFFNLPWILAGDFNVILSSTDRINNGILNSTDDQDFFNRIYSANFKEPHLTGNFFTWRGGLNFSIHRKTDRVFVNSLWMYKFPHFGIHFGHHSISDHTPIMIRVLSNIKEKQVTFHM